MVSLCASLVSLRTMKGGSKLFLSCLFLFLFIRSQTDIKMRSTPGKEPVSVSVGGKSSCDQPTKSPWGQWREGPRRPRYGQHRLHQLKRLLIQLPQQHQQRPLILCNEYPLIQLTLSTPIFIKQHFGPSSVSTKTWPFYKETTFHFTRSSWREIRVDRGLSVLLSGRRPNYDTDTGSDSDMQLDFHMKSA